MSVSRLRLAHIEVLQRGWLSSNNVLLRDPESADVTVVDSGYVAHAMQTVTLVRHSLRGGHLAAVINTHLHSDHCGGNAALARAFGCELWIPEGQWKAAAQWDEGALMLSGTGQRCERFTPDRAIKPGDRLGIGGRHWQVIGAPGHDPHSILLFDPQHGVLISADALWENGFGIVFPELDGQPAFDDVADVLDVIDRLPIDVVIPGHGAPFTDVKEALLRARSRLQAFANSPSKHALHAAKVLVKFRLLEKRSEPISELLRWMQATSLLTRIWESQFHASPQQEWQLAVIHGLCASGALGRKDDYIVDL